MEIFINSVFFFLVLWRGLCYSAFASRLRITKTGATMPRMITVKIREMAEKRGITTAYKLQKALDVAPSLAAKWWSNDMRMIGIETLNRLCRALHCKPNDILSYSPDEE